jgi:hypothetical protein
MTHMLTRRSACIGAVALTGCVQRSERSDDATQFLRRAIAAAGGERALGGARVLKWTGTGLVHAGEDVIEIGVDTVVEPFVYARSTSWLVSQGRAASERTLEINGAQGFAIRGGTREPLPPAQLMHERQQFALYGLMRLLPLLDRGVEIAFAQAPEAGAGAWTVLQVRHPMAPETLLDFDADARLSGAHNAVSNPQAGGPEIAQDIVFASRIASGGVSWPQTLSIRQNGVAYFDLALETFEVSAAR